MSEAETHIESLAESKWVRMPNMPCQAEDSILVARWPMTDSTATLTLPSRLQALVDACEKSCVAECCGIDAYDFSPLHIASHMSAFSGAISESDIADIESEIDCMCSEAAQLRPDPSGLVCSLSGMNQYFTRDSLESFAIELKRGIRLAPTVLEFAEKLRRRES